MNYVILLGAFQALIALFLLPASKQKRPANDLLSWLLVCIFIHLILKFLIFNIEGFPEIRREFNTFIGLAYGPLLWMWARKLQDKDYDPARHWFCFIPVIVGGIFYLYIAAYTVHFSREPLRLMSWYNTGTLYYSAASIVYPVMTLQVGSKLSSFWSMEKRLLNLLGAGLVFLTSLAYLGLNPGLLSYSWNIPIRVVTYSMLLLACILIIHYEWKLQRMLAQPVQEEEDVLPEAVAIVAAGKPEVVEPSEGIMALSPDKEEMGVLAADGGQQETEPGLQHIRAGQLEKLAGRLTQLMEEKKPFLDPELSLEKLAALLQISRNQASELMNQGIGKTFYQYINEYRIREVMVLLDKCRQRDIVPNILSLAFEAGFHSKSSFNLYFKKVTGHTPSDYLKKDRSEVRLLKNSVC